MCKYATMNSTYNILVIIITIIIKERSIEQVEQGLRKRKGKGQVLGKENDQIVMCMYEYSIMNPTIIYNYNAPMKKSLVILHYLYRKLSRILFNLVKYLHNQSQTFVTVFWVFGFSLILLSMYLKFNVHLSIQHFLNQPGVL